MSTHETSQKTSHVTLAERAKGAAHVAHGASESIFGSVMGAVHSHDEGAKAKDEETIAKGRAEVERGFAQMKGEPTPGTATAGAVSQAEAESAQGQLQQPAEKREGKIPAPPEERQQELTREEEGRGPLSQQPSEKQEGTTHMSPEGTRPQESSDQASLTGAAQKGTQGTQQEAALKKSPEGTEGFIGEEVDAPQGPRSCID